MEVSDWLIEQGHMGREEFLSWAEEFAEAEDPAQALEQAIADLHEQRDAIIKELEKPEVRERLFGAPKLEGLTGDDRYKEVFRPGKMAWALKHEIRHEYLAREVGLGNYSKELFVQGIADDYLIWEQDHTSPYVRERHERMLEARRAAAAKKLEESYEKVLAI